MKAPVRVAVTGAAGQISYSLIFRIASGSMLGPDQPVILQLLEIPPAMGALQGVLMELNDCAFPLVAGVIATDDPNVAFKDVEFALLVGSRPRGPGMERSDLLNANGAIFTVQGKALSDNANPNCRVLVVGNPANTNALICMKNAPKLNPRNVTAMMRLDHNRAMSQIAEKTGTHSTKVEKVVVWGNHSSTQYPDISYATVDGKAVKSMVSDEWNKNEFIPTVQQRGAAIIKARGASSAASAASAAALVKTFSRVYSMALLDVGSDVSTCSRRIGKNAPLTTPGLRSGATVTSLVTTVFLTSKPMDPNWRPPCMAPAAALNASD